MKIVEIGTFDQNGCPTYWHLHSDGEKTEDFEACLEIRDDKVFVNNVEIVEWTEKRKRLINP